MQETFNLEKSYVESLQFLVIVSLKCEDHSEILYYVTDSIQPYYLF